MEDTVIEVKHLKKYFPVLSNSVFRRKVAEIRAVDDVSFSINRGETLGLVGESGSGKTTLGRCLLLLEKPTGGEVIFKGKNLSRIGSRELQQERRKIQMIFQDISTTFDPKRTVTEIISEPIEAYNLLPPANYGQRVAELLSLVGLNNFLAGRYPYQLSTGERQRLSIARALATNPEFIVCDEPVSALDVSIQAQILRLFESLRYRQSLTYFFIGHDLAVVVYISNRIAVMYLGRFHEVGPRKEIFSNPLHPYTRALLSAIPVPNRAFEKKRQRMVISGEATSTIYQSLGCNFHPRCPMSIPICREKSPPLEEKGSGHLVACWRV